MEVEAGPKPLNGLQAIGKGDCSTGCDPNTVLDQATRHGAVQTLFVARRPFIYCDTLRLSHARRQWLPIEKGNYSIRKREYNRYGILRNAELSWTCCGNAVSLAPGTRLVPVSESSWINQGNEPEL